MVQFVQKHFHGELAWLYTGLLEAVIWLRAGITVVSREHMETSIKYEGTPAFYLAGDDKSGNEVRSIITTFPNYSLTAIPEDAKEWIFCEGASFSFSQIIEQLKTCPPWLKPFVHASGTYTIVGSHSKDRRGYAIVME
jgi:hypothetical protein